MAARSAGSLPVVIYHYVNDLPAGLTVSPACFEEHCALLARQGWRGVGLDEAEAFFERGETLPAKSLLISFDDGYLDNYVLAWPILRKYGHKAVIFAVADKMGHSGTGAATSGAATSGAGAGGTGAGGVGARPTLEDVWQGRVRNEDLPGVNAVLRRNALGFTIREDLFFTWEEARRMEQSGVVAVAGHSLSHGAVFSGPEYAGFSAPGDAVTAFAHQAPGHFWGRPCFPVASELTGRAFYPDEALLERLRAMVPQEEAEAFAFLGEARNRQALEAALRSHSGPLGRYESDQEQRERVGAIMRRNQEALGRGLGHAVRSFCWPWGHAGPCALEAGLEAGFRVFYKVEPGPNPPGRPLAVRRMNYRRDGAKMLSRLSLYARPWLGELYRRIRI